MRTITTCAGVGDWVWCAMKLLNTGEKFHIQIPDGTPQRAHGIMNILPQLVESFEYVPGLNYATVNRNNITNSKRNWHQIGEEKFYLSANVHLEHGRRIEDWLPDLPTTHRIEYVTTHEDKQAARLLLPGGGKYIGIYTSAYSNARNWAGWTVTEWIEIVRLFGKGYTYVIIGAPYDVGIVQELMYVMAAEGFEYINAIGVELGGTVEVLKRLSYFLGFPSGLSILNATLGKKGVMFYPANLHLMQNAWADPAMIADGSYKGCQFTAPGKLHEWIEKNVEI